MTLDTEVMWQMARHRPLARVGTHTRMPFDVEYV